MAAGSHSTLGAYPRVCAICNERVVVSHPRPLWFMACAPGWQLRSYHFDCRINSRVATAARSPVKEEQ